MRAWLVPVAALLAFQFGCNTSPPGGTSGTGATSSSTFTISAPTLPTIIKQDNKETVKLSLTRGSEFKKDVKLTVNAPPKVHAELSKDIVKASEPADFTITVHPTKDAELGEHKIKVTGTPDGGGSSTSVEFTVKVEKNP